MFLMNYWYKYQYNWLIHFILPWRNTHPQTLTYDISRCCGVYSNTLMRVHNVFCNCFSQDKIIALPKEQLSKKRSLSRSKTLMLTRLEVQSLFCHERTTLAAE